MKWRYQRQPGKNEPICVGLKPLPDQVDKNKNAIVNETQVQKVSVDNTVEVSDTALTIGQLQENMAEIWNKYFVKAKSFPYQRQNDFFVGSNIDEGWKLYNLPNQGVRLINTSIKIEQKVYQLSIPLTMMDSNGRIPLPEFVAKLQNDLNNKLEKAHDAILLERYLKDKYIGWDQLFK